MGEIYPIINLLFFSKFDFLCIDNTVEYVVKGATEKGKKLYAKNFEACQGATTVSTKTPRITTVQHNKAQMGETLYKNVQHNNTQHSNTKIRHSAQGHPASSVVMISAITTFMLSVTFLLLCCAEDRYTKCHYAECSGAFVRTI